MLLTPLMLCVLIKYTNFRTYSTLNDIFSENKNYSSCNFFLFTLRIFARNLLRGSLKSISRLAHIYLILWTDAKLQRFYLLIAFTAISLLVGNRDSNQLFKHVVGIQLLIWSYIFLYIIVLRDPLLTVRILFNFNSKTVLQN